MDHKKYTQQISFWVIVFLVVIVTGFITMKKPDLKYTLTAKQMLAEVVSLQDAVTPDQVRNYLKEEGNKYQLVDLRNPKDYVIGHIDNALNIPMQNLLNESSLDSFKDTTHTFILYAGDQIVACAPWMLLRQLGFANVKVMLGGYDFYVSGESMPEVAAGKCYDEVEKYDYATYFNNPEASTTTVNQELPKVEVPKRRKKSVISGGC